MIKALRYGLPDSKPPLPSLEVKLRDMHCANPFESEADVHRDTLGWLRSAHFKAATHLAWRKFKKEDRSVEGARPDISCLEDLGLIIELKYVKFEKNQNKAQAARAYALSSTDQLMTYIQRDHVKAVVFLVVKNQQYVNDSDLRSGIGNIVTNVNTVVANGEPHHQRDRKCYELSVQL